MTGVRRVRELPPLPARPRAAHKGTFGRILVLAGSPALPGAAWLAGRGATEAGAGLVTLGVPGTAAPELRARVTSMLTLALPAAADGGLGPEAVAPARLALATSDAGVVGPGLGRSDLQAELVKGVATGHNATLVLDADALYLVAVKGVDLRQWRVPVILTPHPGEMGLLLGASTAEVQADREGAVLQATRATGQVVVLKGSRTLVSDGARVYENLTGTPAMASGGAGDVLAGMTAALAVRLPDPFEAAVLAVYLHGLAGDLASRASGCETAPPDAVLAALPAAWKHYRRLVPGGAVEEGR